MIFRDGIMSYIMPIGGNKGGTGKSFIGGNLCVALARERKKNPYGGSGPGRFEPSYDNRDDTSLQKSV